VSSIAPPERETQMTATTLSAPATRATCPQEALSAAEARYRRLVESIQEVILILDANGTSRYISPAFEQITGYTVAERTGRSAFDLIHPHDVAAVQASYHNLLAGPEARVRLETRVQHKNGSWRKIDMLGQNLLHDPHVRGLLITYQDVTEQRRLEDQLREAQKLEAVGRLAGGVAHDFNNLLNVIGGIAHQTFLNLPEESSIREDLQEISAAVQQATSLTQQLLAFSRRQILQPQVLNVDDEVRATSQILRRLLGDDVQLRTQLHSHGQVKVDPGQICQVLMNLTANARDAMPHGGTLTIATRDADLDETADHHHHHHLPPGPYVELLVRDTGRGMDETTLTHIFEPFFTTKETSQGTGLGLATVYGIVRQSGGHIWADSAPGEGTTFRIYLPRVSERGE
jgi:PAS domain S-box-containing protein